MSYIEIERRISVNPTTSGVTVSFRIAKRSSGKPSCVIGLRASFLISSGFGEAATYRIAIGSDKDCGRIKVWPDPTGPFTARKARGARIIDLGHIASFGPREHASRRAAVEMVDGAAVIMLPDLDDGEPEEMEEPEQPEQIPQSIPKAKEAAPTKAKPTSPPAPTPAGAAVAHNGVAIILTEGCESIGFAGKSVDVSPRGARLVVLLAKAMPNCIDDAFLASKLWTTKPPGWTTTLDMICTDLKSLKGIGLEIRTQRGIGRQLVVLA